MKNIYGTGAVIVALTGAIFFFADFYVGNIDSFVESELSAYPQTVESHPKVTKSVTEFRGVMYGRYGPESVVSTSNVKNDFQNNRKSESVRSLIIRAGEIEIWKQIIRVDPPSGVKIAKPESRKYPIEPFFRKSLGSEN